MQWLGFLVRYRSGGIWSIPKSSQIGNLKAVWYREKKNCPPGFWPLWKKSDDQVRAVSFSNGTNYLMFSISFQMEVYFKFSFFPRS